MLFGNGVGAENVVLYGLSRVEKQEKYLDIIWSLHYFG